MAQSRGKKRSASRKGKSRAPAARAGTVGSRGALAPELLPPYQPKSALERWGPGLAIILVTVVAYLPSLDNKFVSWDDDHYVYDNQQVILPEGIKSVWFDVFYYSHPKFQGTRDETRVSHQYYPLVFTLYWLEFRLYEALFDDAAIDKPRSRFQTINPEIATGFHITSLVFHCLNVLLLIKLLRSLGLNTWVASVATALFALTPLNVASVAWAAERKNILAMMFYMLAMMSYLRFRRRGGWYWYVGCLLLHQSALFSKTVAVTFPVMIVLTDRLIDRRWSASSLLRALPLLIQSGIAAGTTIRVEDRQRPVVNPIEQRPLVAGAAIWFYVLKSLVPIHLYPVYPLWQPLESPVKWCVPLIGLPVVAWGLWHWRRRIPAYVYWALAFFLVTQGPMLGFKNINYFQFAFVADHYFYHGGIGLFVLWALIGDGLRRRLGSVPVKHLVTTAAVAGSLAFAVLTYQRGDDWEDAEAFWGKTLAGNPDCWPGWYNTANARYRWALDARANKDIKRYRELIHEAVRRYREATRIKPDLWQAHEKIMTLLMRLREWKEAEKACQVALERFPTHPRANFNLAVVYHNLGKLDLAEKYYLRTTQLRPSDATAHANLGQVYLRKKQHKKAITHLERALKIKPKSVRASLDLSRAYEARKEYESAIRWLRKARAFAPGEARVYFELGRLYQLTEQYDKAIEVYEAALKRNLRRGRAYLGLGTAHHRQGRCREAIEYYRRALKENPKLNQARNGIRGCEETLRDQGQP